MNKRLALISTGGTIEKTYSEMDGILANSSNVLDVMLAQLRLSVDIVRIPLMNQDSMDMSEADHALIAHTAHVMGQTCDGVVVVHGTDRLQFSGEETFAKQPADVPIIFTGAMQPWVLRSSDALQNITEAVLAAQFLSPGVYVVMHNQVLSFPGVVKDREQMRFVRAAFPPAEV